jgi:hypothetical protein
MVELAVLQQGHGDRFDRPPFPREQCLSGSYRAEIEVVATIPDALEQLSRFGEIVPTAPLIGRRDTGEPGLGRWATAAKRQNAPRLPASRHTFSTAACMPHCS